MKIKINLKCKKVSKRLFSTCAYKTLFAKVNFSFPLLKFCKGMFYECRKLRANIYNPKIFVEIVIF